ncbi:flippase [Psychroserpens sp.]|jgi:O-antigen/teichoic acid export membrane protein|uniref:flippase n=1 Tax=Psychroserpens sp. TaxID=2020870 RepID=UPI0039E38529
MLDRTIIKNISSLFSIRVAGYIIPLITLPYLVRVLGPEGYGILAFCLAINQYFTIAVNYGFDLSATKKIAQNYDDKLNVSIIFWNVITVRLLISILGLVLLLLSFSISKDMLGLSPILLGAYLSVFGTALFPQWLFQGKEQLGTISLVRIVLQVINIPLLLFFVTSAKDVWIVALLSSLPMIFIVLFASYLIYKRHWVVWCKPSLRIMWNELIDGWHLFLSSAAISLYTTSTTVMLGIIAGPFSVAIYVAANKLLQAAQGLYSPISASFYPRVNSLMKQSTSQALMLVKYLMKVQVGITLCISLSLFIFAPYVVDILFGDGYERSVTVLKIMSALPIITGLSNIFGIQVLLTHGYKKEFSNVYLYSGIISLLTLIPLCYFFDSEGAATSVVITEIIVTLLMFLNVKKKNIPLFKSSICNM